MCAGKQRACGNPLQGNQGNKHRGRVRNLCKSSSTGTMALPCTKPGHFQASVHLPACLLSCRWSGRARAGWHSLATRTPSLPRFPPLQKERTVLRPQNGVLLGVHFKRTGSSYRWTAFQTSLMMRKTQSLTAPTFSPSSNCIDPAQMSISAHRKRATSCSCIPAQVFPPELVESACMFGLRACELENAGRIPGAAEAAMAASKERSNAKTSALR